MELETCRAAACFTAALLGCVLLARPVVAEAPSVDGPPSEAVVDAYSVAEIARTARNLRPGARLHLEGLALDPGEPPVGLDLERFEAFAAGGTVVIHGADGEEERPFPANAYFRGRVIGDPDSLAVVTVPKTGGVHGIVRRGGEAWELHEERGAAASPRGLAARRVEGPSGLAERGFECGAEGLAPPPESAGSSAGPGTSPEAGSLETRASAAFTSTSAYTARVAVETDHELFQRLGGEAAVTDYVGDLFAYASSVYDRELATDLQVTHLSVWTTAADPWTQTSSSCGFLEFGRYWNAHRTGVERTLAHFVSGKSSSSGIAWLGVLCGGPFVVDHGGQCPGLSPQIDDYGGAYGFSSGIRGSFDPASPSPVWDLVVLSHEIGHNFDSPHTHCYNGLGGSSSPVDECYNAQASSGCYDGETSLPGPAGAGSGTIMSYCHLLSPGLSNVGLTFGAGHPYGVLPQRVPDRMRAHVAARAAQAPACLERRDGGGGGGPCEDLALSTQTVSTTELFETCGTLTAGDGFEVVNPGDVTLRGGSVVLESGFSVGMGARLRIETQ